MNTRSMTNTTINNNKKLEDFLEKTTVSEENSDSAMSPFMMQNSTENNDYDYKLQETKTLLEEIPFKNELKFFYQIIANPSVERYINNWTFMSLTNIKQRYLHFLEHNQKRTIDFALHYIGMGHCIVVAYDPDSNKIYYRHDGGSNGYDREYNFNFIKIYTPEENKCYTFQSFLEKCEDQSIEMSLVTPMCVNY